MKTTKALKPNGYIAECPCGEIIGAIDLANTEQKEAGKILGQWISKGCTLKPRFGDWVANISPCKCDN